MKHLGREPRSTHAEEHHICKTASADSCRKRLDACQMRRDEPNRAQPSEAVRNHLLNGLLGRPYVETACQEPLRKVQMIDTEGTLSGWRVLLMMVEHDVHHRSQIDTYAGMNGWDVPDIFGRSAEAVELQQAAQRVRHGD